MKSKLILLIGLVFVVVGATVAWICFSSSAEEPQTPAQRRAAARAAKIEQAKKARKAKKRTKVAGMQKPGKGLTRAKPKRPTIDDDEKNLTPQQKAVLVNIQDALDHENLQAVRSIIDQFNDPALRTAKGEVPVALRARAVEALGWFGKSAAIDMIGYLGDPDPEVAQDALNQFELALEDGDMSDLERSAIVKAAMKAITDPDVIDSLLSQLDNMRNSRRGETIVEILTTGTRQARKIMAEQLTDYTEDGVVDVNGVAKWVAANPDDENDEEFYGGSKEATEETRPVVQLPGVKIPAK